MRKLRLKAIWLLILPFFYFAAPTGQLLAIGVGLGVVGLFIRAMAAGFIHKDQQLTTTGPYAFTRNPLYLGSFLLGLGVTTAGGQWIFAVLFLVFFGGVYGRTISGEASRLTELFGDAYLEYSKHVPIFFPRPLPWRQKEAQSAGRFDFARYKRNREYEALLGAVAGFGFLAIRLWWL